MDDMLAFIIFDHLQCLATGRQHLIQSGLKQESVQGGATAKKELKNKENLRVHDIPMCDCRFLSNFIQRNLILTLQQQFHNLFLPISPIPQ